MAVTPRTPRKPTETAGRGTKDQVAKLPAEKPAAGFLALVKPGNVHAVKRAVKPILTLELVKASRDGREQYGAVGSGPLQFPVSEVEHKGAVLDLRRAAKELDCGLSVRSTVQGDGSFVVDFDASVPKKTYRFTRKDIRAWGETNGFAQELAESTNKLPANVREAFWKVHGKEPKAKNV